MKFPVLKLHVGKKRVRIVEDHHHALLPWAWERNDAGRALRLLTLDHHTDTLQAFTHYAQSHGLENIFFSADFRSEKEIRGVLGKMRHDEQIDFAIRSGIVDSALLVTHENFSVFVNPRIRILHEPPFRGGASLTDFSRSSVDSVFPGECFRPSLSVLSAYYAKALEDDFFLSLFHQAGMADIPEAGFLLDVDLDYFKTPESLEPEKSLVFYELIRRSRAVTISRERDWVRLLNLDFGRIVDYAYAEKRILEHIERACSAS